MWGAPFTCPNRAARAGPRPSWPAPPLLRPDPSRGRGHPGRVVDRSLAVSLLRAIRRLVNAATESRPFGRTAAVLVWVLGRPSVLPLAVVLAALIVPMAVCTAYVRRRRVDTEVHSWNRKRVLLAAGFGLPIVTFVIGAFYAYAGPASSVWRGAIVGAAFGGLLGVAASVLSARRKRREEAAAAGDEG